MSTADEPARRMTTRGGAKDKMAKVVERFLAGGIVRDDSNLKEPSRGTHAVFEGKDLEITPSSTKKKTNAKVKPTSTVRSRKAKATTKSNTSKGVDVAVKKQIASRLAELEDEQLRQYKASCLLYPRHLKGKAPEPHTAVEEPEVSDNNSLLTRSLGQPVMNSNISDCGGLSESDGNSGSKDESTHAADKTIEVANLDDAAGECLIPTAMIVSRQRNIAEGKLLNSVNAELYTQREHVKVSRPKPRRVQPQVKDLSIPPRPSGKATAPKAITQSGAKPTATDDDLYQNTTKEQGAHKSKGPQILAMPYDDVENLDDDQSSEHQDLDGTTGDGESDIKMEVMEPTPAKKTKTKAGAKGEKVTMSMLRDEIRWNRKEAPNLEIGLGGSVDVGHDDHTFETPTTKKNITNQIEEWAQEIPPPPFKKQRTSVTSSMHSASLKANPNLTKATAPATASTKSTASCAIIVGSTTDVLRKKPAPGSKRWAEDVEFDSDVDDNDSNPSRVLGEYEDDTLEQADAASSPVKARVAAQMSKKSLKIRRGITAPVKEKKPFKRQGNQQLPDGACTDGRWAMMFVPTFLRYIGSTQKDAWALKLQENLAVLQAIWNEVYKGSAQGCQEKIKHLVEQSGAVHNVSIQRVIEWRSSIGSNGLTVVGNFMSSSHLETCEERQEAAEHLLHDNRYIYLKTRDEIVDGKLTFKRAGRYRGPLVVRTVAQCWVDFDGAVDVPGFVECNQFPHAALVLSATSVYRALWLWAKGYITKESHDNAKLTKSSSIIKAMGRDGKFTKTTNFSKDQWAEISDMHMRDVVVIQRVEPEKLQVLAGDVQAYVDILRQKKRASILKESGGEGNRLDKKARGSGYQHRPAASDSDV